MNFTYVMNRSLKKQRIENLKQLTQIINVTMVELVGEDIVEFFQDDSRSLWSLLNETQL